MVVLVRYFASLRELRRTETERVPVEEGTTVSALYARLFPVGPQGRLPVLYAVNLDYVPSTHPLRDGDEVAFIPPIGGG